MTLTTNGMAKIKRDMAFTEIMQNVLMSNEDTIKAHIVVEEDETYVNENVYSILWDRITDEVNETMNASEMWGELEISLEDDEIIIEFRIEGYDWSELRTKF